MEVDVSQAVEGVIVGVGGREFGGYTLIVRERLVEVLQVVVALAGAKQGERQVRPRRRGLDESVVLLQRLRPEFLVVQAVGQAEGLVGWRLSQCGQDHQQGER